jgi:hypothetical protein
LFQKALQEKENKKLAQQLLLSVHIKVQSLALGLVEGEPMKIDSWEPRWLAMEWMVGSLGYHWATTVSCFLVPGLVVQVLG